MKFSLLIWFYARSNSAKSWRKWFSGFRENLENATWRIGIPRTTDIWEKNLSSPISLAQCCMFRLIEPTLETQFAVENSTGLSMTSLRSSE